MKTTDFKDLAKVNQILPIMQEYFGNSMNLARIKLMAYMPRLFCLGRWNFFLPCIDDVGHQTNFPFVPIYKRGYGGNHNVSYPVQKMYRLNHSETVRSLSLPTAWRTHARKRYYLSDIPRPCRSLLYPSSQNESPM